MPYTAHPKIGIRDTKDCYSMICVRDTYIPADQQYKDGLRDLRCVYTRMIRVQGCEYRFGIMG